MNFLKFPEDIQYKIINDTGIKCHICHKKYTNIYDILNSKKINNYLFCSEKCYLFC